ncbi:nickel-responsive transcriptional regulator NikR [Aquamicrobium segne]|uniref:Putative nickel-responsive regulator n=1 Tax=Aquamicrobium segne TaxID=469547 RepID=A0ABW0GWZ8_9HYPH
MKRITITMDDDLMEEMDRMSERNGYQTRSEIIRDLVRLGLRSAALDAGDMPDCVGILSYVYNHEARDLAQKLTASHHDHHDISIVSMHIHLDMENCLEISILKGATDLVRNFSKAIIAQKSVSYGELRIVPQRSKTSA